MNLNKVAVAGSLESNDVLVTVRPIEDGINLDIDSIVKKQFGYRIEEIIYNVLEEFNILNAEVKVQDRGALDPVLEARLETAIKRAIGD